MWTRQEIKSYAKDFLRQNYLQAFLVCLIVTLFTGGGSSNSSNSTNDEYISTTYTETNIFEQVEERLPVDTNNRVVQFVTRKFNSPLFILGSLVGIILVAILTLTVGYVLQVGQSRFFLHGFDGDVNIKKIISPFNSEEYVPIVKTQFLRGLYTFLWSLLFIIPGIIKSYEYRFVPYILAENPLLSSDEVIHLSKRMTHGHKMDIFVLDLSFIGWYLLGGLFFGIGAFFVDPYAEATNARLYTILSGRDESQEDHSYTVDDFVEF